MLHVQPFSQTLLQFELPQVADTLLSSDKLSPGTMVGPYEIESELGAGGMGIVYRARHLGYKGEVALKVLSNLLSPAGRQRFALEQEHLAWFTHPSIAQIYSAGTLPNGMAYSAMEYVQGQIIYQLLQRAGTFTQGKA